MPRASLLVTAALTLPLAACAIEDDDELELDTEAQGLWGCSQYGCDSNTGLVADKHVGTLSLVGVPNGAGMRPTGIIQKAGVDYLLQVTKDQLIGLDPITKLPALTGFALDGAVIPLKDSAVPPVTHYINIEDVYHSLDYWVGPTIKKVWSYRMTWGAVPNVPRGDVCPEWPTSIDWPLGNNPKEAIVLIGDRYNPWTKDVQEGAGPERWFNIACAGGAIAKLHLNRHTTVGSNLLYDTDADMRSTMLHMYTASYCENGKTYTHLGVPLWWQNTMLWNPSVLGENGVVEAVWGPDGAVCLDRPRLSEDDEVEDDLEQVAAECGHEIPLCDAESWADPDYWMELGYIVSKIP